MKFEHLQESIALWAQEKGISAPENAPKQVLKVVEELDAFGDVLVTIIILAEQRQVDLVYSLQEAYSVIKDRAGKTVNGVFVKDEE